VEFNAEDRTSRRDTRASAGDGRHRGQTSRVRFGYERVGGRDTRTSAGDGRHRGQTSRVRSGYERVGGRDVTDGRRHSNFCW
jgi:hypothetical protein